ncbi:MAG TPA: protein kinase [Actinomycetota bacterium]|nr:protein kinase [Actinomycetota bacterium]
MTSRITRGPLADFWRCEDEVLGRPVAAKILRSHLVTDPAVKKLFRKEAVAAAKLTHANIVSVFDTGEHNGAPFIVMEYLGGGSLRERLASGPLAPATVAEIGAEICAALAAAHKMGVAHGNIRPENVLFTEAGHLKVSDFAIAKAALASPRLSDPGSPSGNTYAPPELASGATPDARSDIYSLGAILYECAVGLTPAAAARERSPETGRPVTPGPRDLRPEIPEELELAIIGAIQKDPAARFQTARSLEKTLRRLAPGSPPAARQAAPAAPRVRVNPHPQPSQPTRADHHAAPARQAPSPAPDDEPPRLAAPRHRADSFLHTEGRWLLPTVLVIAAAAALVFTIPSIRTGIGNVVGPQTNEQAEPLEVSRAAAYDPPPGDGEETTRRLGDAVDGDPDTSWATSSYSRPDLGGLKDGVGIFVDLGSERELSGLRVTSVTGGWEGSVRYSDDGRNWSDPGEPESAGAEHTFETSGSHRYWMVWITELVLTSGEGTGENPYAVAIREIEPLAAG